MEALEKDIQPFLVAFKDILNVMKKIRHCCFDNVSDFSAGIKLKWTACVISADGYALCG